MELLEVSKKLRREVKKAGMDLEKQMKPINSGLRVKRGAVTGGVKEKRAVNDAGLKDFLDLVNAEGNYNIGEVELVEKDLSNVVLKATEQFIKSKAELSFNVTMLKGKITLESISFIDTKLDEVTLNVTLKDVKESLKTLKTEA